MPFAGKGQNETQPPMAPLPGENQFCRTVLPPVAKT